MKPMRTSGDLEWAMKTCFGDLNLISPKRCGLDVMMIHDVMFLDCGLVGRFSFCRMNFLEQLLFTGFVVNPRFLAGHPRQTEAGEILGAYVGRFRFTTSVSTR